MNNISIEKFFFDIFKNVMAFIIRESRIKQKFFIILVWEDIVNGFMMGFNLFDFFYY